MFKRKKEYKHEYSGLTAASLCESLIRRDIENKEAFNDSEEDFEAKLEQIKKDEIEAEFKRLDGLLFDENGNNTFNQNYHKFQRLDLDTFWKWTKRHPNYHFDIRIGGIPVRVQNGQKIPIDTPQQPTNKSAEKLSGSKSTNTGNAELNTFQSKLHCENKDAVIAKLHELLNNEESGRNVAKALLAMISKNYLLKKSYKVSDVITEFNLTCSRQSITMYTCDQPINPIPADEIQQVVDFLP